MRNIAHDFDIKSLLKLDILKKILSISSTTARFISEFNFA